MDAVGADDGVELLAPENYVGMQVVKDSIEGNMGTQCYGVYQMVVENMVEDGIGDFDQNHHLDSVTVVVIGNRNDADDGGMLGWVRSVMHSKWFIGWWGIIWWILVIGFRGVIVPNMG